jgi:hypothetical protein
MHYPPGEGNFCDEHGNTIKLTIIQVYNCCMGYVDKGDWMAYSCSVGCCMWKLTNKLFLHLLDLTVLNSCILLQSCGGKMTHYNFWLALMRNLIKYAGTEVHPQSVLWGRLVSAEKKVGRLDSAHNKHWLIKATIFLCCVCSTRNIRERSLYKCTKCDISLSLHACIHASHIITESVIYKCNKPVEVLGKSVKNTLPSNVLCK